MNTRISLGIGLGLVIFFTPLLPREARAASVVPGFTEVNVGERGRVSVALVLRGPAKGPLKVGLLQKKRLSRAQDVELMELGAEEFTNLQLELYVGRSPIGTHTIGIEGPRGIIAKTTITVVPGPKQETVVQAKSKVVRSYLQKRDGDLGRGFLDESDDTLAVIFFLKIKTPGDAYTVDFKHKKDRVCGDLVYPAGYPGQVVKVMAQCRPGDLQEEVSDDVVVDEYAPIPMDGSDLSAAAGSGEAPKAMPLSEITARKGPWKVEVRQGKKLKRVLSFSVKGGKVVAGAPGRAPLKIARVKVVSR